MGKPRLGAIFASLELPTEPGTLRAARIAPASRYRVARATGRDALFLFELDADAESLGDAREIRLQHFEYEPRVTATLAGHGRAAPHVGEFLVLRCREASDDLRAHFFELLEGLIDLLGEAPSAKEADGAIHDLVELFRAMSGPSRRTIMGLWGELLLIADARDVAVAAAAWHGDPKEQHDFVSGAERIEIKSTTRPVREHVVGLEQLVVPDGGITLLVSLMLEPNDAGTSANDLLSIACDRLPAPSEARRRLRAIFAETLGEAWREAGLTRFDLTKARESRCIFDARSIPSVDPRIPPEVSRVQFTVDLSGVVSIAPEAAAAKATLAAAIFARVGMT